MEPPAVLFIGTPLYKIKTPCAASNPRIVTDAFLEKIPQLRFTLTLAIDCKRLSVLLDGSSSISSFSITSFCPGRSSIFRSVRVAVIITFSIATNDELNLTFMSKSLSAIENLICFSWYPTKVTIMVYSPDEIFSN